ncbi:MAG: Tic22 family protein [Chroococcales cyanobacterium]
MKSLLRWSTTLSLAGSAAIATLFGFPLDSLALPEQQIIQKLDSIPVFTVTNGQGAPLVASTDENQGRVAGVFISQSDAQQFLTKLRSENPELGNQVQVTPVSLGEIYKLENGNNGAANGLDFAFVPKQQQVQSAQTIWSSQRQQNDPAQFAGVPLFVARSGGGYLTLQQNNEQIIPFFFDQQQVQQMVERFKQQQPNMASDVTIEVVPLEGMIATLQNSNDQQLTKVVLVPSQETIQFIQSLPPGQ